MGDFLLDFRTPEIRRRSAADAARLLKFCDDTRIERIERDTFSLTLSRVDEPELWDSFEHRSANGNVLVALAGRIALDETDWESARRIEGSGGLACKAIYSVYRKDGARGLGSLNGNFVAFVHDAVAGKFHFATDRCGMFLAYGKDGSACYGSHADVLASVLGEGQNWDMGSLAEFLMTSRLTFPATYYRNIRALDPACIYSFDLRNGHPALESRQPYFRFDFAIDPRTSEDDLAEEFAAAFKNAVRRRTLPLFGRTGIGLSGGLDSRTILSAADRRNQLRAFCLFDEENAEFNTAKTIAEACDVEMIPVKREFDYYGNSAELGVRISGGTGCVTCNHFLGARDRLREFGIQNILTGCYCDYLFKGLALNRTEQPLSRKVELGRFDFAFYDPYHRLESPYRDEVMGRVTTLFPESGKEQLGDHDWLSIERKRSFPLAYEQDLAQRVIPQRVMPWFVPVVDNDLMAVYLKMPPRAKLNSSLFRKMLRRACPERVRDIPDNNTGSRPDATWPKRAVARYSSSLRNRLAEKVMPRMATRGSWPNWSHYFRHSKVIESLWNRPNKTARDVLTKILGRDPYEKSIAEYADSNVVLFQRLLTQKLWLDQRM